MRLNYLLLVHGTSNFRRMISRLTDENTFIYVHVDSKVELEDFNSEAINIPNIKFIASRENVVWGNISMVKATLNLIEEVKRECDSKSYNILMSGSDYPIKSNQFIRSYFQKNYGKIFLSSRNVEEVWRNEIINNRLCDYNIHPLDKERKKIILNFHELNFKKIKRSIVNCIHLIKYKRGGAIFKALEKREFPKYLRPYGGSQWWAFPMDVLDYIDDFLENHPDYINYHNFTHAPDEIFFHSIISSNFPKGRIRDSITYVNWSRKGCSLPVTFSENDIDELKNSDCLYARKFDPYISLNLLDLIDKGLLDTTTYKSH